MSKSFDALPVCGRGETGTRRYSSVLQSGDNDSSVHGLQRCVRHTDRAHTAVAESVRMHQLTTTFCTWSVLETLTPSIFSDDTRTMSGNGGGSETVRRVRLLLVNSISTQQSAGRPQ